MSREKSTPKPKPAPNLNPKPTPGKRATPSLQKGPAAGKPKPISPDGMMAAVTASMAQRTGRSLDEWVVVVQASGVDPLDRNAVRRWLRAEHGVLQNSGWAIANAAARAAGWVPPVLDEYIEQQYAGPKAPLRPIFERLRDLLTALGDDVTMEGRSTYIPFVRRRQFAAVAVPSRQRVEVGLRYTAAPTSRLLTSATAPGQATHKLSLASADEIGDEVERLLRAAYEQNG